MFTKRIVGIDYGRKRIGIAYSDPLRLTAQPLATIILKTPEEAARRVLSMLSEYEVELVVVGLPVSIAGGKNGLMADEVRKFAKALEREGYVIALEDEAFTSAEAASVMRKAGKTARQMRGKTDSIAAQLILQDYLDSHRDETA